VFLNKIQHVRRSELGNEGDGGSSCKRNQGEGAESGGKGHRGGPTQDVTGLHLVNVFIHNPGFYDRRADKVDAALGP